MQYKGWITIPSNPDYHPIMQTDPCISSNAPSLGSHGEPSHPLYDIVFSGGGVAVPVHDGYTSPDAGIWPYADETYTTKYFHSFTFKLKQLKMECTIFCEMSLKIMIWKLLPHLRCAKNKYVICTVQTHIYWYVAFWISLVQFPRSAYNQHTTN